VKRPPRFAFGTPRGSQDPRLRTTGLAEQTTTESLLPRSLRLWFSLAGSRHCSCLSVRSAYVATVRHGSSYRFNGNVSLTASGGGGGGKPARWTDGCVRLAPAT